MHPYASPQAPLLRPDPVFVLRRTGRRVGLGAVLLAVTGSTVLVAGTIHPDATFLVAHAACALGALLPVGILGGPYVAFQGAGSWWRWTLGVAQTTALGLICAGMGVLLAGSFLAHLGHPSPYGGLIPSDPPSLLWLTLGSICLALTISGLSGLILRSQAQTWVQVWAPDPESTHEGKKPGP